MQSTLYHCRPRTHKAHTPFLVVCQVKAHERVRQCEALRTHNGTRIVDFIVEKCDVIVRRAYIHTHRIALCRAFRVVEEILVVGQAFGLVAPHHERLLHGVCPCGINGYAVLTIR